MNYDTALQVRLRRTDLATATKWLMSQGVQPRSLSEVMRTVFEVGVRNMPQEVQVNSTAEAVEILRGFKASGNPTGRLVKQLYQNVEMEESLGWAANGQTQQSNVDAKFLEEFEQKEREKEEKLRRMVLTPIKE